MTTPYYVSDSFTINSISTSAEDVGMWHYPGTFNMEKTWGPSTDVACDWAAGEFGMVYFFSTNDFGGCNADVFIGLYNVDTTTGVAIPVPDSQLKFLTSTGAVMGPGILINAVEPRGTYARAQRNLATPVALGGVSTPTSSGVYQLGAHMRFFGPSGAHPLSYQYFMQGTVGPSTSTGGGSTGASTTFSLNGLTYTVTST